MKVSSINSKDLTNDYIKELFFSFKKEEYDSVDYMIIYGCHIKLLLKERLEHALDIIRLGKVSKIVLTGGIGVHGDFNESEYMLDYLVKNNVDKNSIIIEDKSTTTEENNTNVMNILNLTGVNSPLNIVLVTHQFHLFKIIIHWHKILNNPNIHFYYDYVEKTIASYDNAIINPIYKQLLIEQVEKAQENINNGIYDDIDISEIIK